MSDRPVDLDPFDTLLRARLERLTDAIPVDAIGDRSGDPARRPRPRILRGALLAAAMVGLVSLGAIGMVLWVGRPQVASGAFGPGQPLHCSGVDQLAPLEAARWLTAHGLTAHWQVEDREAHSSVAQDAPPDHGSITDALALADGHILILVELSRDEPLAPKPCP